MPKTFFAILLLSFVCLNTNAQRQRINFDEGWKFQFGHAADPAKDFNYGITAIFAKSGKTDKTAIAINFNDSNWRTLDLPHDWAVELPFRYVDNFDVQSHGYKPVGGLFRETSIGWYRKHFTIARKDSGQRFQIEFDGIFRDAHVWMNGFYLGNNQSGYVGVGYDITDYINYEKPNVITVRVDATQYEGWFYEGAGIYRHVWLNRYPNNHFVKDGVFAHSAVDGKDARVTVEAEIINEGMSSSNVQIYTVIEERNGRQIAWSSLQKVHLPVNEVKKTRQTLIVKNVRLWELNDPYLYRIRSIMFVDGKTFESVVTKFGVRTIDIKPNGVFLNGKHVKLLGTNNHQDHAGVGSALPDHLQYYRIALLKEMGSNSYRTSHNAPTPELLDACDSLGMLVMDEQRLLNSSPEYMSQFERLIRRDRNHPSVFMWSIGNEEGWLQANNTGKRIAQTMLKKQKELDPTRT